MSFFSISNPEGGFFSTTLPCGCLAGCATTEMLKVNSKHDK
jgi:hypothetical protein